MDERLVKWRLILGKPDSAEGGEGAVALPTGLAEMDGVLEALYDSDRQGGLGSSSPNVNRWLGDIRKYFPGPVVQVMQRDALERLDLEKVLMEPELLESLQPDVHLAATLLSLRNLMPDETRATARHIIEQLVRELEARLREPLRSALKGAVDRARRRRQARPREIDWRRTIQANLRHYQPEYKTVIPEKLIGYGSKAKGLRNILLLVDQSGSMASSVVYAGVLGSVMASVNALQTHFVAFDTSVADLSEYLHDPVELLFGLQLGGGTDINRALKYGSTLLRDPSKTIVVLISDLFEGGNARGVVEQMQELKSSGAHVITLLALNDEGAPAYNRSLAGELAALRVPVFACTPEQFPGLMAAAINREDLHQWMAREGVVLKN